MACPACPEVGSLAVDPHVPQIGRQATPIVAEPVTVTWAVDDERAHILWRCEAEDCPSRVTEPGRSSEPFVGRIEFTDREDALRLLATVAVAHATLVDQAPLGVLAVAAIEE